GNVIAANLGNGVTIDGATTTGNVLQANLIGLNATATGALPNSGDGIALTGGVSGILIGSVGLGNVISSSGGNGVRIDGGGTSSNVLWGNAIGGNAGAGVLIQNGAANNLVGGVLAGQGNMIAMNAKQGVAVGAPGSGASDTAAVGNAILRNSIFSNGLLGID